MTQTESVASYEMLHSSQICYFQVKVRIQRRENTLLHVKVQMTQMIQIHRLESTNTVTVLLLSRFFGYLYIARVFHSLTTLYFYFPQLITKSALCTTNIFTFSERNYRLFTTLIEPKLLILDIQRRDSTTNHLCGAFMNSCDKSH